MCDTCANDPRFTSKPGTAERLAEIDQWTHDKILEVGHTVTGVFDPEGAKSGFYYTVGRSVFEKPELYLSGSLDQRVGTWMLNTVAKLHDDGELDVEALANSGEIIQPGDFGCQLRFTWVDAYECEMFGATSLSGKDIPAIQVIWPDAEGRWPEDPEFAYGPDAQLVHSK